MKKSFSKLSTFALALSMGIILLALPSCKSLDLSDTYHSTLNSQHSTLTDTLVLRDTVYRHDSVIYRERTIHDTVYITKEVYRDRLHSTLNSQHSTIADTVHLVEYRDRVIEHPPERYVPKFYKWCTIAFWVIGLLAIGYGIVRWRLRQ